MSAVGELSGADAEMVCAHAKSLAGRARELAESLELAALAAIADELDELASSVGSATVVKRWGPPRKCVLDGRVYQ